MKASKEGNPFGLLGSRTFITPERQLVVSLSVDDQMPDHDYGWHEYITAELVITAFKGTRIYGSVSSIYFSILKLKFVFASYNRVSQDIFHISMDEMDRFQ